MKNAVKHTIRAAALTALIGLCGCSTASKVLNPFYEPPSDVALKGEPNDHALNGQQKKIDTARQALEQMATYQRQLLPQPNRPVMQPAVVRLMWIPDHLNVHGDMVPAHYYYLKVLKERWNLQDAFELEGQLGKKSDSSNVPFIREGSGISR